MGGIALAGTPGTQRRVLYETVNDMKIWIPVAILVIVVLAFAGLLPLPGQKDNVTPMTQPGSPQVEAPKGPPETPQTPPGTAR